MFGERHDLPHEFPEHAEELKFKRVSLKDKLYAMLKEHAG